MTGAETVEAGLSRHAEKAAKRKKEPPQDEKKRKKGVGDTKNLSRLCLISFWENETKEAGGEEEVETFARN